MVQFKQPRRLQRERVSEEKGGKMAMKGYTLPLQTQTPYRSKQEKNGWLRMSFIKSCLNVAKSSTCFLNSTLMFANRT